MECAIWPFMCLRVLLASLYGTSSQAMVVREIDGQRFNPRLLTKTSEGKVPFVRTFTKAFAPVVTPKQSPLLANKLALALMDLPKQDSHLGKMEVPLGMSRLEVQHLMSRPDRTISLESRGATFCIEAIGAKRGDVIGVNRCTGVPGQLWDVLPNRHGQQKFLRLSGTDQCLDMAVEERDVKGLEAPIVLLDCENEAIKSWTIEESIRSSAGVSPHSHTLISIYVASPSMRKSLTSLVILALLMAMSLGAWFRWQAKGRDVVNQFGSPWKLLQHAASLTASLAGSQDQPDAIAIEDPVSISSCSPASGSCEPSTQTQQCIHDATPMKEESVMSRRGMLPAVMILYPIKVQSGDRSRSEKRRTTWMPFQQLLWRSPSQASEEAAVERHRGAAQATVVEPKEDRMLRVEHAEKQVGESGYTGLAVEELPDDLKGGYWRRF